VRARAFFATAIAGLLTLGLAAPARAVTDSVLVRVGGNIAGRAGDYIDVPVTVDLSGAPGRSLGSYTAKLQYNPALLQFSTVEPGSFAAPQVNAAHAADSGTVLLTAVQPSGASGAVVVFYARFYVTSDTAASPVTISFSEMSATATSVTPFESLLPLLQIVNGTFCRSLGRWGDVNGDGDANSLDALVALSVVVGIPVDTTTMNPGLADVDGDGRITSRDALIILTYAVGLPVNGYRVLLNAAGACGTGSAITIAVMPDSLELQVGQTAPVVFAAADSSGRAVAVDTGSVTSSAPAIAGWTTTEGGRVVVARAPGVAIFTVRLGPGVATTFKVVVLARRTTWYVDVARARLAPTQLGDQALPFEYIGDALNLAHNGDTVLVAGGTYEEQIGSDVAATILGDSTDRPVIDPRGSPNWSSSQSALDLEPMGGQIVLANLDIRAGTTYLAAHDVTVRKVLIEGLGSDGANALEMETAPAGDDAPPARASGPQRSDVPQEPGNILVDGVVVTADSASSGIVVDLADTAVIRNSTVTRTAAGTNAYCGLGPYNTGGILVKQASVAYVHDNVVANPSCTGIGAFDTGITPVIGDVGRVTISRNRVTGAPATGIGASAHLVAFDHNSVQGTGTAFRYTYGGTVGIHVIEYSRAADSVTSLADTVSNSGGRGLAVDTAGAVTIDSLVMAGTGQDSSGYGSFGVDLEAGGHFALSHSRISNTYGDNAVNVKGDHSVIRTHGNYIVGAGYDGISAYLYGPCDGCAPIARAGPERSGPYVGGPDTLISVSDTILNTYDDAIYSDYGVYTFVDSLVADSAGYDGVEAEYLGRLVVQNSRIRRTYYTGIELYEVDSVAVRLDSIVNNFGEALYVEATTDTARVYGLVADSTGLSEGSTYSALDSWGGPGLLVDSSVISNAGYAGLYFEGGSGGRVQRSRIESNDYGVLVPFGSVYDSIVVRQSTIQLNAQAGAENDNLEFSAIIDADSNYWGDPNGPTCQVEGPCSGQGSGDFVTSGVTIDDWLSAPAITPAAPFRTTAAVSGGPARTRQAARAAGRPLAHRVTAPHGSGVMRPGVTRSPSTPMTRPATSPRAAGALRQPVRAWHAPSKAKSHAVQIIVKRRPV